MKKDMIILSASDFLKLEADDNIREARNDAEYQFDYESWKAILYSSSKIKFIMRYFQGILRWMDDVIDLTDLRISISVIISDKFNFTLFKGYKQLFSCSLLTYFYLIAESEWAEKIVELHSSHYDLVENELLYDSMELNYWFGEEGFGKFVNMLLLLIRDANKIESVNLPIQWNIEFKDKKLAMSRIRMQIEQLQGRIRPSNEEVYWNEPEIREQKIQQVNTSNLNDDATAAWNKYYKKEK